MHRPVLAAGPMVAGALVLCGADSALIDRGSKTIHDPIRDITRATLHAAPVDSDTPIDRNAR